MRSPEFILDNWRDEGYRVRVSANDYNPEGATFLIVEESEGECQALLGQRERLQVALALAPELAALLEAGEAWVNAPRFDSDERDALIDAIDAVLALKDQRPQ